MTNSTPNVLTIIINYNSWELTTHCLASLTHINKINHTIIVVDNGSTNDSIKNLLHWNYGKLPMNTAIHNSLKKHICILNNHSIQLVADTPQKKLLPGTHLLKCTKNHGFSGGNNKALELVHPSNYDFIWYLNNDTIVTPNALSEKINVFNSTPRMGLVSSTLYHFDEPKKVQMVGGTINQWLGSTKTIIDHSTPIDFLCGASLLMSSKAFESIGKWDDTFFLNYEDADLSYRAKQIGLKIKCCETAIVYHKESATFSREVSNGNLFVELCRIKSRIIFSKKYKLSNFGIILGLIISVIIRIKRRQFKLATQLFSLTLNIKKPIAFFHTNPQGRIK
jgi:GT2 family glycosyltransferase